MSRKPSSLPLAAARERLRGKPGRPRKPKSEAEPEAMAAMRRVIARLLDVREAAAYLSVSTWTIRDLIGNGTLRRVRIQLPNNGELRRLLVDREDLDRLVAQWKDGQP